MKAFRKNENTIVIQRHPNASAKVEAAILEIKRLLLGLRACCEDRSSEAFPHELVEKMVKRCEDAKATIDDLPVDEEYVEMVLRTKDVVGYFEKKLIALAADEAAFARKKECFSSFAEMLENVKKEYFSS